MNQPLEQIWKFADVTFDYTTAIGKSLDEGYSIAHVLTDDN